MCEIININKYKERKRRCDNTSNKGGYRNSTLVNTIIPNSNTSQWVWLRDTYRDIGKNIDKENK